MSKKEIVILVTFLSIAAVAIPVIIIFGIMGVGITTFTVNKGKDAISSSIDISQQEISAFNSKFEGYSGAQKGTSTKALLQAVRNSNNTSNNEEKIITVTFNNISYDKDKITQVTSLVKPASTYIVNMNKNSSGYINKIDIKEK